MTTGINFWDSGVWNFVLTLTILFLAMMVANTLRNLIKPLRQFLIPSSVLGGFLLLIVNFIFKKITGSSIFQPATMEMLTYHGLGLGFVAMSLRNIEKSTDKRAKSGGFDTGVTVVATYLIQAIIGLIISIALYYIIGSFFSSGLLLPMGYGQGPGQAYNWGHNYEATYGFAHGTSFGLTVAAMGFVAASVGGVIYLNVLKRKGLFKGSLGEGGASEHISSADIVSGGNEIPLSESMDKFTIQLALVFIAYALAYLCMLGINAIIETGVLGNFGYGTLQPLVWGFNFLFGTLFGLLLKAVLNGLKKKGVIRREYMNNFMQNRISGFMFDIMVVASIAAIDLSAFKYREFIVPLVIICVAGGVISYFYLDFLCKRVFPNYRHEAFLSLYGMLTGTASTGVILLRESDQKFETPASMNIISAQPWAIVFGFPMLLLLSFAPQSLPNSYITLALLFLLFIAMNLIVFRRNIFKRKKAK